jgi:hypothetical protein
MVLTVKAMEAVKILEDSREGLPRCRRRGTFRWWRRELRRPSPAEAGSRCPWKRAVL